MGGLFAQSDMDSLADLAQQNNVSSASFERRTRSESVSCRRAGGKDFVRACSRCKIKTWEFWGWPSSPTRIRWPDPRRFSWRRGWSREERACERTIRLQFPMPSSN